MAISLPVTQKWAASWLDVDVNRLGEGDEVQAGPGPARRPAVDGRRPLGPHPLPEPEWQNPHITPDAQSRRHLCTFPDPDLNGRDACFSWHGRKTPGKGRLHFRLVPERKVFRLAYVGPKPGSDRLS
ncbi:hypothetical protein [Streptomyces sp. NPDC001348]